MVAAKKAIESTYIGTCTITEQVKIKNPDKTTGFKEQVILENQPCRLSFEKITGTNQGDTAASTIQGAKVFISPDVSIKPGSKLTITQNGITTDYQHSGVPAIYGTHQEVILELFKGWS